MAYPSSFDNLVDPAGSAQMNDPALLHSVVEKAQNDAIEAIQQTLGLNPQGGSGTVAARLNAIETSLGGKLNSNLFHQPFGVATLDASGMLVENVDAAKVSAGTLAVARIPSLPGTIIGSGTIALARLPSIPTSQITGTLPGAQVGAHDAALITSGTISASRLPSSVTANANARVVTLLADRDAIPTVERADGMLVLQRSPQVLWQWRADQSAWIQVGGIGQGAEATIRVEEGTDQLAFTNTTPGYGSVACWSSFTAPPSGRMRVKWHANFESNTAGSIVYIGFEIRTGSTQGGGSPVQAFNSDSALANGNTTRMECGTEDLVTGLTPGTVYHCNLQHMITGNNGDIFYRRLILDPVR